MTLPVCLRGGFVSGFVVRKAGAPVCVVGGGAGREEERRDQESFPFGEGVTTPGGSG